ncbi:hypothetical protein [Corallococcus exercitus]|uniref:hypothetical protein n=1 Tax=Corallococcus exercitus TaxID=2316736 RepID=UPI0035D44327
MDEKAGLDAIAQVVRMIGDDKSVRSVGFDYSDPGTIIITAGEIGERLESLTALKSDGFKIIVRKGPRIEEQVGNVASTTPVNPMVVDGEKTVDVMGGDAVTSSRAPTYYGTVSLIGAVRIVVQGERQYDLLSLDGIVSNNHVIAQNDTGVRGDVLSHKGRKFGSLMDAVPMTDLKVRCDVALGEVDVDHLGARKPPAVTVSRYRLRGLGDITGVRAPVAEEKVMKSGATSGVTEGTIVGRATVFMPGRTFPETYKTSGGFTKGGDSGALIVGSDMRAIGIHAWGDVAVENGPPPASYFAGFINDDAEFDFSGELVLRF